ncbi:Aerobic respiration control sensor protein ArcB [Raoultella terrigena]|uniref:Aerobic respiration control sensor protein ArcB n=1 Tax=Raoultella terrigena TaxID=577 RepID=A0A4U9D774_RAOTE|nr:Aerobic respiration control sensor protein ArcB [Raoultella terrigena]
MKQIRMLAQYYVDLMMKLGLVRFSMLLALALVVLAIVVQMAVTMVLHGQVESIDVIRSIFFGLLITRGRSTFCRWWLSSLRSRDSASRGWWRSWRRCASGI